ncbi:MAG: RHS repeat domain-containing protein [Mangrovibacterium sp.]
MDRATQIEIDYYGANNDDYVNGAGFCCGEAMNIRSIPVSGDNYEKLQYYYHPDHLGSASYITNLDGEVVQHIEYVPFGEVFLEERNNTWNTPFLFNGKELDEETGLYYYGARYYNPRIGLWYGVDALSEKYPAHSPYCYTMNNPVMLVDPDGKRVVPRPSYRRQPNRAMYRNNKSLYHYYNGRPLSRRNIETSSYIITTQSAKHPQYIETIITPGLNNIQVTNNRTRGEQALTLLGDLAGVKISYIEDKIYGDYGPETKRSVAISFNRLSTDIEYQKLQSEWEKEYSQKMESLINGNEESPDWEQSSFFEMNLKIQSEIGSSPSSVLLGEVEKAVRNNEVEKIGETKKRSEIIPEFRQAE